MTINEIREISHFLKFVLLLNKGKSKINYWQSRYIHRIEKDCSKVLRKLRMNYKSWFRLL